MRAEDRHGQTHHHHPVCRGCWQAAGFPCRVTEHAISLAIAQAALPAFYRTIVAQYWTPLADYLAARAAQDQPLVVGINGAQGSGKSTACRFVQILLGQRGLKAAVLGLDDLYLTHAERLKLAREIHPLFATRGVPGTHDIALGNRLLDALLAGDDVRLPIFNKAIDDRTPETQSVTGPVQIILLEGWCIGAAPQPEAALAAPINALEREEDPQAIWRSEANRRLASDYAAFFARIDVLVMLKVENFLAVAANRRKQEHQLARDNPGSPGLMDDAALARFGQHYERLTRWMLNELPQRADIIFAIGPDQSPLFLPQRLAKSVPIA